MVNHTSTYHNHGFVKSLTPATRTADANGTGIDLQDCDDVALVFSIGATGDTLSGSVKLELEVEESDDNSTFTDCANADLTNTVTGTNTGTVAVIDDNAEDDLVVVVGYKGTKRYIRPVLNFTGTHTNGIPCAVMAVRGRNRAQPVNS